MPLRVAILGNMNNNGFAIMRYLRDLGVDAHLFLYRNDGIGSLDHFKPENDSFEIDKWNNYIHNSDFDNHVHQALPGFAQYCFVRLYNLYASFLSRPYLYRRISAIEIKNIFGGFDRVITSGYGLAIFTKGGIKADIFFPYSMGIEGVNRFYAPKWPNLISRLVFEWGRCRQLAELRRVKNILTGGMGGTENMLESKKLAYNTISAPMVYIERSLPDKIEDCQIQRIADDLVKYDFTVLMHSSLVWNAKSCETCRTYSKNNHWLLYAFKIIIDQRPKISSKLFFLEYGPDVANTKQLVSELELEKYVIWIPKTSRKNLMWLIRKVTLGVGEFIEAPRTLWGGTGWEILASGRPLLQGFFYEDGEFERLYGYPEPPLLKVRCQEDVIRHLLAMADNPEKAKRTGQESRDWFHRYNGNSLAIKWLEILEPRAVSHHQEGVQPLKLTTDV